MSVRHPLGVQPCGNAFLSPDVSTREAGLGDLARLSDAFVLRVVEALDVRSVGRLMVVSKAMRCFASYEEIWKKFVLEVLSLPNPG